MISSAPARSCLLALLLVLCSTSMSRTAQAAPADYPSEIIADYVFGCMASNGQSREALRRCACSIDHIAAKIPYDAYVEAETVLRMQLIPSADDRVIMFRTSVWAKEMVDRLRKAQIEAEFACF